MLSERDTDDSGSPIFILSTLSVVENKFGFRDGTACAVFPSSVNTGNFSSGYLQTKLFLELQLSSFHWNRK